MPRPIRILVVDDHPLVRMSLALGFEPIEDLELVGEAADGDQAIELASRLQPDIVLMDYNMPRMNGAEATRRIRSLSPECRVVGLSLNGTEICGEMRNAGAVTCIAKGVGMDIIIEAVRMVAESPP